MARIYLYITTPEGKPIPGARVRVVDAGNADKTFTLFGVDPALTDSGGIIENSFPDPGPLTPGVYTFHLSATGYANTQHQTLPDFRGDGMRFLTMTAQAVNVNMSAPLSIMSTYAPISVEVRFTPGTLPDGARLKTVVNRPGHRSEIRSRIRSDGKAIVDIRSRCELPEVMFLVPDDKKCAPDPSLYAEVSLTFFLLTPTGETPLTASATIRVARLYPNPSGDLNDIVDVKDAGLFRFIAPIRRGDNSGYYPAIRGYYQDVPIFMLEGVGFTLVCTDSASNPVHTIPLENEVMNQKGFKLIRIPELPNHNQFHMQIVGPYTSDKMLVDYRY